MLRHEVFSSRFPEDDSGIVVLNETESQYPILLKDVPSCGETREDSSL